jgi:hypothetical protein
MYRETISLLHGTLENFSNNYNKCGAGLVFAMHQAMQIEGPLDENVVDGNRFDEIVFRFYF